MKNFRRILSGVGRIFDRHKVVVLYTVSVELAKAPFIPIALEHYSTPSSNAVSPKTPMSREMSHQKLHHVRISCTCYRYCHMCKGNAGYELRCRKISEMPHVPCSGIDQPEACMAPDTRGTPNPVMTRWNNETANHVRRQTVNGLSNCMQYQGGPS